MEDNFYEPEIKLESFNKEQGRFELISLTYQDDYKRAFTSILDKETGKIKREEHKLN